MKGNTGISRRSFLKVTGAAALSSAASTIVMPYSVVQAAEGVEEEIRKKAISIAETAQPAMAVIAELVQQGFQFSLPECELVRDPNSQNTVAVMPKMIGAPDKSTAVLLLEVISKMVKRSHPTEG